MPLEMSFNVEPDEHGVFDGRELARHLVAVAFRLLVPYVDGCPACADTMMNGIANDAMGEAHAAGELPSLFYASGDSSAERGNRMERHIDATRHVTAGLLGTDPMHHH